MQQQSRIRFHAIFLTMGFVATAAQILVMRRFIVVFGGNELVTGGVFAGWLGFSGLGNLIVGRFADRIEDCWRAAAAALAALALCIPLTITASYLIKPALGMPAPLMIGPGTALVLSAILMAPIGLMIGACFTLCARLPGAQEAEGVPRVYLMDAIGSGIGGIAVSLIAIRYLTSFQSSLVAASLMLAVIGLAFHRLRIKIAALACLLAVSGAMFAARPLQRSLAEVLWRGYNPTVQLESLISSLMVTANRGERTLFRDGQPAFSLPLEYTYETISNLPLIEHGRPADVAMIEGGLSGTLDQWKRWDLNNAYFLRLDPEVTYLEQNSMPSAIWSLPEWMHLKHVDGRRFIKDGAFGKCEGKCLDVLVVNVGEPDTAATDRYFTREFFEEAEGVLRDDGVLAVWMLEPQNAIGEETAEMLGSLMATLKSVFPRVAMLPLDRFYFFASNQGAITDNIEELMGRISSMGVDSPYLEAQVLPGIFQERVDSFSDIVEQASASAPINEDRRPRAYFNGMLLWEKRFGSGSRAFATLATAARPWMGAALLALLMAGPIAYSRLRKRQVAPVWALAAIGFSSMAYEIALLIHNQMAMGVMVYRLGFIITAFMVGAGLGAFAGLAWRCGPSARRASLVASLAAMAALALLMFETTGISFIASNFAMGLLSGYIYQAAAQMIFVWKQGAGATAGITESADHGGALVGSLVTGLIAVPLFGLWASLVMAAVVLAAAMAMVAVRL